MTVFRGAGQRIGPLRMQCPKLYGLIQMNILTMLSKMYKIVRFA